MIDTHQVQSCLREIDKLAMPSTLARAGVGAAIGAALAGGTGASKTVRDMGGTETLKQRGVFTPAQADELSRHTLRRFGGRLLGGAALGGAAGVGAPHALNALKHYSGEAAAHLGRNAARGAAEHAAPAARAVLHEARAAAPDIGAVAGRAAGKEVADEMRQAAPSIGRGAADGVAAAAAAAGENIRPKWPGRLRDIARDFIRKEDR